MKIMAKATSSNIYRVSTNGGEIESISREDAIKQATASGIFDEDTVTSMLDGKDVAFSEEHYFAIEPDLLSKWASKPYTNGVEKSAEASDGAVDLDTLKAEYPDEVKDEYATQKEAEHAFMLGDATALSRVTKAGKKTASKKAEAESPGYFRMLGTDTGTINPVSLEEVKDAVGKKMTAKTLDSFIASGRVFKGADGIEVFGPTEASLVAHAESQAEDDTEEDVPQPKAPKAESKPASTGGANPLKAGDQVRNFVTKASGVVVDKKGTLVVETTKAKGSGTRLVDITPAWEIDTQAPAIESEDTAIVKAEPVLPDKPLTATEHKRLEKLEAAVEKAKDALESAPFVMGAALDEIRQNKLFRETVKGDGSTCKTFGEYAEFRFDITREYAQNIAQISGFMDVANEAIEGGEKLQMSVGSANILLRDTNKLSKMLGVDRPSLEVLRPLIVNATALLVDIAPKNADGHPIITPRLVESFNEKLRDHLHGGVIEIDGKQMTVEKAREKGLLNASLQEEVITSAAESILRQGELIKSEAKAAYERQNEPVSNGGDQAPASKPEFFKGVPPSLAVDCDKHGATSIISIGNGRFQTKCQCRWHIDADTATLVCYEVKGKRVKR